MSEPIYPINTKVWNMWGNALKDWWSSQAESNRFAKGIDKIMQPAKYSDFPIQSLTIADNPAIAMLAGAPAFKKLQSFEQLESLRKTMQAAEEGRSLVNSAKNARAGKRPRIKIATQPGYVKTTPLSQSPEALAAKQAREAKVAAEARAAQVKANQIDLAKQQRRLWEQQGINTSASERKAMMKAIEINPATSTPPPEGLSPIPYKSGAVEWEGAPLSEWFNLATEDRLPYGPNALWRKLEKPLQSATNWNSIVGPVITSEGVGASKTALDMLGQGLAEMAPYLKKCGGILSGKSGIHIKKENRGKFTSYCGGKVTSECIARGKASPNPAIRKRATFAANSRKWAKKHQNGGKIIPHWVYNILGGE